MTASEDVSIAAACKLVRNDTPALAVMLLQHPKLAAACDTETDSRTLLHHAAGHGKQELVRQLLDLDADIHAKDVYGETPIFRSIRFRKDAVTAMILDHHKTQGRLASGAVADVVNVQDGKGRTPLHRACAMGTAACVEMLLDAGSDPTVLDDDGITALAAGEQSRYAVNEIGAWRERVKAVMKSRNDELADAFNMDDEDDEDLLSSSSSSNGTPQATQATQVSQPPSASQDPIEEHATKRAKSHHEQPQPAVAGKRSSMIVCNDGHLVQTEALQVLDDWLYEHCISHAIAPLAKTGRQPCFYLNGQRLYLEICSKDTKEHLVEFYHERQLECILLDAEDVTVERLDRQLPPRLESHRQALLAKTENSKQ